MHPTVMICTTGCTIPKTLIPKWRTVVLIPTRENNKRLMVVATTLCIRASLVVLTEYRAMTYVPWTTNVTLELLLLLLLLWFRARLQTTRR
jgi:hypothetical protein